MPKPDLKISIKQTKETVTVALIGEARMDLEQADAHIEKILSYKPKIVIISAGKLTFISSTGIYFLINLRKAIHAKKGTVQLTGLQPNVKKALVLANVLKLFEVT